MTIHPPSLKSGDLIAIVAPAGNVYRDYIEDSKKIWMKWGLNVLETTHLYNSYGRFSGTEAERLEDLQSSLDNPDIRAVFCARGGYGVVQIMGKISLKKFKTQPKWVIGYSDITALHSMISQIGICSLHAPMSSHFSKEGEDGSTLFLKKLLFGEKPAYNINSNPLNRPGISLGYTRGGNLSVLQGLRGTPNDLLTDDTILFIEDVNEKPYHIERMMYNLKMGNILSKISGLIVGKFEGCEEDQSLNKTIYESIAQLVAEYDYPVCFDFPTGHIKENFPLIENGKAKFSVNNTGVKLEYL